MGIIDKLKRLIMGKRIKEEDKNPNENISEESKSIKNSKINNVDNVDDETKIESVSNEELVEEAEQIENKKVIKEKQINKDEQISKEDNIKKDEIVKEDKANEKLENELNLEGSLHDELKKYRAMKSKEENIVEHFVFKNKEIDDIVKAMPKTVLELKTIKGFGEVKCRKYGEDIIKILSEN